MEQSWKVAIAREWVIFALCLGLGGHVVLGLILHAPEQWPGNHADVLGLLVGFSLYVVVQVMRSLWWVVRGKAKRDPGREEGRAW